LNCILAVDIGTTSTKALLVQPDGKVIASAQSGYLTSYPQSGYAEQDAEELLQAVKKVIRDCAKDHSMLVRAVSFSCAMHSLIAVDERGKSLSPVILWGDTRSSLQAKKLRESKEGGLIYQTTGTPLHPSSPLCKLMWMKENKPSLFNSASKFISIKEYIFFHLTGEWAIDFSLASATGMFDVHQLRWMPEAVAMAGIDEARLSPCVSPYHFIPLMNSSIAHDLHLPINTPFVLGASDGCLANLGSGVDEEGELSITIGTSGAARMTSSQFCYDSKQRIFNYRLDEDTFVTGGATNNGSVLLKWFSDQILNETLTPAQLIERAMKIKAGAQGLLFLPYVLGERAPFYDPEARGVYFGLAHHHTSDHMLRALVEGICFGIKSIVTAIEESAGSVDSIIASGGFTRSTDWLQLLADILGKEIHVNDPNDASALGAAIIGFRSLHIETQFLSEAHSKVFIPDESKYQTYSDLFQLFQDLTALLQPSFDKITALQND
jgi:gluconokinase